MIIRLKQGEKLYLKDIPEVSKGEVTEKFVHDQLLAMYYMKVRNDEIEPFKISYGRGFGLYLAGNAYVGIIRFDVTTLIIESKIPELDIGKILYLSTISSIDVSNKSNGKALEAYLADEEEIDILDFFVIPLIDALSEVFQNGLLTESIKEHEKTKQLKGRLDIHKQISKSPSYGDFHTIKNVDSPNISPNRVLLKAIRIAKLKSNLQWVKSYLNSFEESFMGVDDENINREDFLQILHGYTTLKRKDYESALILSEHIIFGFDPSQGNNFDLFPEYLLDLNRIFESYVMTSLMKVFKTGFTAKDIFTLGLSPEDPPIDNRFIELDGMYRGQSNVIIDAKNKYNGLITNTRNVFLPSNPDLYQQFYYAARTESTNIVLVYPSTKKTTKPVSEFEVNHEGYPTIKYYCWALKITGSPRENKKAIEGLAQFIDTLN